MGGRDRGDERAVHDVAANDQPAAVAAIGQRTGDQSEQQVGHDPQRKENARLRSRARQIVHESSGNTTVVIAVPSIEMPSATAQRTNRGSDRRDAEAAGKPGATEFVTAQRMIRNPDAPAKHG